MVHALQYVLKDINLSTLLSYPSVSMGPRLEIPLYREWSNAISERISVPIQIVLDGLDRLSSDAPSFGLLQVLVKDVPSHIHLIMLSREELPLGIQGLKMKQEVHVLTNEDLAFTLDEVKTFLREIRGLSFLSKQLTKIHQFTEGWVGGLILLSESLERLPKGSRQKYILEDIPDRFKRDIFQYFGEEILSSQPGPIQQVLIKSSLFDIVDPGFVEDVFEIKDTAEVLHELSRKNLFVHSNYDEKKGWLFRYHQLFRDFLQAKFKSEISEKEQQSLFFKAGSIYEQRDDLEESVKYYLEAKAYDRAASVIERMGMDLLNAGRTGDLSQWLRALPEEFVQGNPWLLLYLSLSRRYTAVEENFGSLQKAFAQFEQHGDVRGQLLSLAYHIEACMIRGRDATPLSHLIDQGEGLLQSMGPEQYHYERAVLWVQMAFGLTVRGGDARRGLLACQNAYLLAKKEGHFLLQATALINALQAHSFLGEFSLAEELIEKIEKLLMKYPYPELQVLLFIDQSSLWLLKGEFEKGEESIHRAQNVIEEYGLVYLYPYTLLYELMLQVNLENYDRMEVMANRLLNLSLSLGNSFLQGATLGLRGIGFYKKGDFQKAKESLESSLETFSSRETRSEYHLATFRIIMGLTSYHLQDNMSSYEKEIQKILDHSKLISDYIFLVEGHFTMALLKWRQGKTSEADLHLRLGFKIAEERGLYFFCHLGSFDLLRLCLLALELNVKGAKKYADFFCHLGSFDLLRLCLLALELNVKGAKKYAAYLLANRLGSLAEPELKRLSKHPNQDLREKAQEIHRTIYLSKVPRIHIETLGGFQVLREDSPMDESEWKRSQPKNLLKSIVARGAKKVPRDLLMEDLWPEGEYMTMERNFKVALHRLRKSLEPEMDKDFKSSYIHLKDNLVSLTRELCEVDIDSFLSLIEKGKSKEKEKNTKTAISLYTQAAERYKGDFLSEDLYAPWADIKREELKRTYINLLLRLAQLHEDRGTIEKAIFFYKKATHTDSVLEKAYQRLMRLYSQQGKRNEALKVYEACKEAMRDDLDIEPDEVTVSLYKKILEKPLNI
jgi:ATP/maltotriose-dependent transcriptional regulator MalT/DNA-binding SARP family transcriptional activator